MRRLLALILTLSLVLTAQAMASAKGQAAAMGSMVICAGGVSVTVAVDADGQPVGPAHYCPECALAMLPGMDPPMVMPGEAVPTVLVRDIAALAQASALPLLLPPARGPPLVV